MTHARLRVCNAGREGFMSYPDPVIYSQSIPQNPGNPSTNAPKYRLLDTPQNSVSRIVISVLFPQTCA